MWKPTDTREENHRRLKGKDSDMFTSMSKEAIEQYLEAAREAGFEPIDKPIYNHGYYSVFTRRISD
jgi:hypothetical protein